MAFKDNLKKARLANGFTKTQIANFIGVSYESYQNYEYRGSEPRYEMLVKIADVLGVTTDYLLGHNVKENVIKEPANMVDHPKHYGGKFECIDVMIMLFGKQAVIWFCRCNIFKYRFRSYLKNGAEDIAKAEWYENKLKELLENEEM